MSQTSIFSSESFPRYKLIFEGAPNNQQENWTYKVTKDYYSLINEINATLCFT